MCLTFSSMSPRTMVHEDLDEALDEPGPADVVPVADEAGDGGVGDDHVLPRRPRLVHLAKVVDRVCVLSVPPLLAGRSRRLSELFTVVIEVGLIGVVPSAGLNGSRFSWSPLSFGIDFK